MKALRVDEETRLKDIQIAALMSSQVSPEMCCWDTLQFFFFEFRMHVLPCLIFCILYFFFSCACRCVFFSALYLRPICKYTWALTATHCNTLQHTATHCNLNTLHLGFSLHDYLHFCRGSYTVKCSHCTLAQAKSDELETVEEVNSWRWLPVIHWGVPSL